jgi:hypothetical protein
MGSDPNQEKNHPKNFDSIRNLHDQRFPQVVSGAGI